MTHIDKNYAPIILGDYIGHQEIYIDKQINIVNGESSASETFRQAEPESNAGTNGKSPVAYMGKRVERIFSMAEEIGLLSQAGNGYVWHENNTLLDYFLGRTLCGDYPSGDDKPFWCFGEERKVMPADDMNRLFERKDIGAIRRARKMLSVPYGHEPIDEIIDEANTYFMKAK